MPSRSHTLAPHDIRCVLLCRDHLLQPRWYSHSQFGKLHCAISISDTLRSLPIYESAATAAATAAAIAPADAHPQTNTPLASTAADPPPAGVAAAVLKGVDTRPSPDYADAGGVQPAWLDLSRPRFLAPPGIPPAALTGSFVAAGSAAAELVLSELLGVQRISLAEAYRYTLSHPGLDL